MNALDTFTRSFLPEDDTEIIDVDLTKLDRPTEHVWVRVTSRSGRVLLLDIRDVSVSDPLQEHLCVDAFPYIDGEHVNVGYYGMTPGTQHTTPDTGFTSHGWPATGMAVLLLGKQGENA